MQVQLPTLTAAFRDRAAVPQPKKPEPQPEVEKVTETIEGERLNIYLALPPDRACQSDTGSGYETYFINDSNYYLFFNYMNRRTIAGSAAITALWSRIHRSSWKNSVKKS